jgi:hypothetical protein
MDLPDQLAVCLVAKLVGKLAKPLVQLAPEGNPLSNGWRYLDRAEARNVLMPHLRCGASQSASIAPSP